MDLKNFIKEKQNSDKQLVHPFAYRDINFKYLYCFGLGVLACGSMRSMTETRQYLDLIVDSMLLHSNYKDKIVIDINNNFDYKINDVFELLETTEEKYCFTSDLYRISIKSLWAQDFCDSVIENYMQIFHLEKEEKEFFHQFILAADKMNKDKAMELYRIFMEEGFQISYKLLHYIFPGFLLEEVYEDVVLEHGSRLILDKPTLIKGNVIVRSGGSLLIDGAGIKLEGSIMVSGGKISIKNADIMVKECNEAYVLSITDTAVVTIEDTKIDCNFKAGMLIQDTGFLILNNTTILHTKKQRAITFSGRSLVMNGTSLQDCMDGGIQNLASSEMNADDCSFYHCTAPHGAAVHSDSLSNVNISNSRFHNCNAKFLGGAVYFTYKKFGQNVNNCVFHNCSPKDSKLFNAYETI